ncbi:MAG: ferritin [Promethearchaeota archaeon]
MLSEKINDALNQQINEEFFSGYLYWAMANWFESQNWLGFAQWLKVQAQEEYEHAERFYNFIHEIGGEVELLAVKQPPKEWNSPLDAFKAAYEHEKYITGKINELVDLATELKDNATLRGVLDWFVTEQIEEEEQTRTIVEDLERIGDHLGALHYYDKKLGKRKKE